MAEKKDEKKEAEKGAELTPEAAAAKKKKKKLIIIAAAGLVGVAGIGGGAAFFLGKGKKPAAGHAEEKKPDDGHGGEKKADAGHAEEKKPDDGHGGEKKADDGHGGGEKTDKDKGTKAPLDIGFGKTMPLAPFHLNLGNPVDNRYVRLEIAIEYGENPDIEAELKARMPQLRDAIVSVTRKKSREFLLGPDGTDQLRLEIKNRVNQFMKKPIDNVYVTDILIE